MPPPEKVFAITDAGKSALETLSSRHKKKREILQTLLNGPLEKSDLIRATKARETHIESCLTDKWLEVQSDSLPGKKFVANHELNFEQRNACDQLISVLGQFACFLLFGVTGSGKTEVYLNLIAEVLSRGKQALVLVPEIALTPTLESLFRERFPDSKLSIQHSNMGQTARANAWIDSSTGRSRIVLGTRLAVFSPMNRLGLIVVDEEQDSSYKQNEGLRYSARDLAIFRGRQVGAPVLLCSATPSPSTNSPR